MFKVCIFILYILKFNYNNEGKPRALRDSRTEINKAIF